MKAQDLIDEKTIDSTLTIEPTAQSGTIKRVSNPFAILYILLLLTGLTTWLVLVSLGLAENRDEMFPKAVIAIPFLILLFVPPIISLLVILFRTFYTLHVVDSPVFAPLDLVRNETQRHAFLLPLSVSGLVMTILPAYYLQRGKHYEVLGALGALGLMLVGLFLGNALIYENSNGGILNPIHLKKINDV